MQKRLGLTGHWLPMNLRTRRDAPNLARVAKPPLKSIRMGSYRTVTEDGTDFRWRVRL